MTMNLNSNRGMTPRSINDSNNHHKQHTGKEILSQINTVFYVIITYVDPHTQTQKAVGYARNAAPKKWGQVKYKKGGRNSFRRSYQCCYVHFRTTGKGIVSQCMMFYYLIKLEPQCRKTSTFSNTEGIGDAV